MILVTGGTGFIGEQLVRSLAQQGEPVRLLVRRREKAAARFGPLLQRLELAEGDLGDPASLQRAVDGVGQVYHLASWISYQGAYAAVHRVNVVGTRNLLEACRAGGVQRLVHVSSIAAGGPGVAGPDGKLRPRTEEDPPQPLPDPYGLTKLEQERLVLPYGAEGPEAVVVRPSAVFGPGDPEGINTLLWMVRQGRMPFYLGAGHKYLNLVFVRDVVRGMVAAMVKGRAGRVYNLVGPNLTQAQAVGLIAEVSGGKTPRLAMPVPALMAAAGLVTLAARLARRRRSLVHPNDIRSWTSDWLVSDTRMRAELGIAPTDMTAALRETIAWLEEREAARQA